MECNALVESGPNPRSHCGGKAVTGFVDDIDGTKIFACKRHSPGYRRNPKTWREVALTQPTASNNEFKATDAP